MVTGTMAASTAVTGEMTLIGATVISPYISTTPTSPAAPPSTPYTTAFAVTAPGNSGNIAVMSTAPTG